MERKLIMAFKDMKNKKFNLIVNLIKDEVTGKEI